MVSRLRRADWRWQLERKLRLLRRSWHYSRFRLGALARERARADMRRFYQGLNGFLWESGCEYWLAYGTLLGYRREQDLILGDEDLDFGLFEESFARICALAHRLPAGFRLIDTSARHGGPKLCIESGFFDADLYFYGRRPLGLHLHLDDWMFCDKLPLPEYLVQPTRVVEFLGQPTRVPEETDALLTWTYGYTGPGARQDKRTGYYYPGG